MFFYDEAMKGTHPWQLIKYGVTQPLTQQYDNVSVCKRKPCRAAWIIIIISTVNRFYSLLS